MSDVAIRLRTFGGVDLTGPREVGARAVAAQPKRLALLVYLAAAQPQGFHRKDSLLALFWPESAEGPARRALNRAVYFLRHELGRDVVLSRGDEEIAVSDEVVWSDVGAFGRALDGGRLEEGLDLYRGDFAPGFFVDGLSDFERWMESERARLQERALEAALALARREEERGALEAAGAWARRATMLAPHDERAARRRMALLDRAGDRAGALNSYAALAERLRDDLGVEPSPETQALEAAVRSRRGPVGIGAVLRPGGEAPPQNSPLAGASRPSPVPRPRVTSPRLAWAAGGAAAVGVALAVGMTGHRMPSVALGHRSAVAVAGEFERWPALSPDGRTVYYTLTGPGGDELYLQQVESGTPLALTLQLPGGQRGAAVSPDGTRLLFLGDSGLYLMPSLGGEARRVVPARIPADAVNDPGLLPGAWAPDGRRIAYPDGDTLFVQLIGTGARIPVASGGGLHSPAWSPDGRWIAFVRGNYAFHIRGNRASSAIMVVRSTGGPSLAVTDTSALHTSPVWVPGRQMLLYISDRDGGRDVYLVRLGRDGRPHDSAIRLTTGLEPERLSISADGRRLAWSVFTESSNLWALDIPARDSVPLSSASPVTTGRQFIEAVGNVSPEGTWLYYHSDRAGDADLWRLPLAGGQAERLTTDSALDFAPAVSPDGRDVAFHSLRHDRRDIYVMPVAGGPQVRVSVGEPQGGVPAWSTDGRALAWLSGSAVRMARRNADGTWTAPRLVIAGYGPGGWAQWSPDGRWISYPMLAGLTLVDPETHRTRLMEGTVGLRWQVWSPNGGVIYGMRELDDQRIQMLAIPVAGGPPRPIAWADHPLTQQARYGLALHRGRLYFPLVERSADVWVGDIVGH